MTSQLVDGSDTGVDVKAHEQIGKMFTYLYGSVWRPVHGGRRYNQPEAARIVGLQANSDPNHSPSRLHRRDGGTRDVTRSRKSAYTWQKQGHRPIWADSVQLFTTRAQVTARKDTKNSPSGAVDAKITTGAR